MSLQRPWTHNGETRRLMEGGKVIADVWPRRCDYSRELIGWKWWVYMYGNGMDRYAVEDTMELAQAAAEAALLERAP